MAGGPRTKQCSRSRDASSSGGRSHRTRNSINTNFRFGYIITVCYDPFGTWTSFVRTLASRGNPDLRVMQVGVTPTCITCVLGVFFKCYCIGFCFFLILSPPHTCSGYTTRRPLLVLQTIGVEDRFAVCDQRPPRWQWAAGLPRLEIATLQRVCGFFLSSLGVFLDIARG